jgi:hypothetical protein
MTREIDPKAYEQACGCDVEQLVKIHQLSGISYDKLLGFARSGGAKRDL